MARMTGSWLFGPSAAQPQADRADTYRGELLGLPQHGLGALASTGRRVGALMVDWLIALSISSLVVRASGLGGAIQSWTLLVWFLMGVVAVTLFGYTPGQFFLRIRVMRVDAPTRVGFVRALVRSVILLFVIPALFTDADGRGMHDRATGTALTLAR